MARSLIAGLEAGAVKPHHMAQSAKLAGFRRHWWDEAAVGLLSPELNKGDETVPPLWTFALFPRRTGHVAPPGRLVTPGAAT